MTNLEFADRLNNVIESFNLRERFDPRRAERTLKQFGAQKDPSVESVRLFLLGFVFAKQNLLNEAADAFNSCLKIAEGYLKPAMSYTAATFHYQNGSMNEAEKVFSDMVKSVPALSNFPPHLVLQAVDSHDWGNFVYPQLEVEDKVDFLALSKQMRVFRTNNELTTAILFAATFGQPKTHQESLCHLINNSYRNRRNQLIEDLVDKHLDPKILAEAQHLKDAYLSSLISQNKDKKAQAYLDTIESGQEFYRALLAYRNNAYGIVVSYLDSDRDLCKIGEPAKAQAKIDSLSLPPQEYSFFAEIYRGFDNRRKAYEMLAHSYEQLGIDERKRFDITIRKGYYHAAELCYQALHDSAAALGCKRAGFELIEPIKLGDGAPLGCYKGKPIIKGKIRVVSGGLCHGIEKKGK